MRNATDISKKVANPFYLNCIVTLIVGFLQGTPLVQNPWLGWLQDSTVCLALLTIIAVIAGYQSRDD